VLQSSCRSKSESSPFLDEAGLIVHPGRLDLPEAGPSRRAEATYAALPLLNQPFVLNDALTRTYKAQYSNIYFQRLLQLRQIVASAAEKRWAHVKGALCSWYGGGDSVLKILPQHF
jgi:hypothetical protein